MNLPCVQVAALVAGFAAGAVGTITSPAQAEGAAESNDETFDLPPVPVDEMTKTAPQPSWDTGLLLSACGQGDDRVWETTKFCVGALGDVVFLRKKEDEMGLGGYAQVATAGFRDVRGSLGLAGVFSLVDWFALTARGGGLLAVGERGAQPGLEGYLEFGHRSVSLKSRYALSHSLMSGIQYTLQTHDLPTASTIWVGIRLDAVWLTAPVALFR